MLCIHWYTEQGREEGGGKERAELNRGRGNREQKVKEENRGQEEGEREGRRKGNKKEKEERTRKARAAKHKQASEC